jgi:hypothetical protein
MKDLEKTWWFSLIAWAIGLLVTINLLERAGVWPVAGWAQCIVMALCLGTVWRAVSFTMWLIVLMLAPSRMLKQPEKSHVDR